MSSNTDYRSKANMNWVFDCLDITYLEVLSRLVHKVVHFLKNVLFGATSSTFLAHCGFEGYIGQKKYKGKFRWKHLDRPCKNAKTLKWKKSIQGIKSCHLEQASRTARIWQFGRSVLGGNFWFPRWIFFNLMSWHSYNAYLKVFTWICLWTFFYPMYPSNPQWVRLSEVLLRYLANT